MLCKHFKGTNLIEKNIYRIVELNVQGSQVDESVVTYSGDNDLKTASNLVVYANIFQDDKLFCREYEDISSELSDEKKAMFNQTIKVQPLTPEEIDIVNSEEFINNKKEAVALKYTK